jgi:hypothetical protein
MPHRFQTDDELRKILWGNITPAGCRRYSSRLDRRFRKDFVQSDLATKLHIFCSSDSAFLMPMADNEDVSTDKDILLSARAIESAIAASNPGGSFDAGYISPQTLLLDIEDRAAASQEALVRSLITSVASANQSGDRHDFVTAALARLKSLKELH